MKAKDDLSHAVCIVGMLLLGWLSAILQRGSEDRMMPAEVMSVAGH